MSFSQLNSYIYNQQLAGVYDREPVSLSIIEECMPRTARDLILERVNSAESFQIPEGQINLT